MIYLALSVSFLVAAVFAVLTYMIGKKLYWELSDGLAGLVFVVVLVLMGSIAVSDVQDGKFDGHITKESWK